MEQVPALLVALAVSALGEWLAASRKLWPHRRLLAVLSLVAAGFAVAGLLVSFPGVWSLALAIVSLYRCVNLARLMEDRMHEQFARRAALGTAGWLGGVQLLLAAGLLALPDVRLGAASLLTLAVLQVAVAGLLAWSVVRQLRRTSLWHEAEPAGDSHLPAVTVAIPARNEDARLDACLTSLLASDYPKLEVIVLDDCSQDKTPDIIRSYAQAGVRFISGRPPAPGWLAKNQAYEQLYQQASGSLVLFCGVDARFRPGSVRLLVNSLQRRHKTMLSVLPLNPRPGRLPLVQAMRYYWEMAPPRRLFNRPPVLGCCWLITRHSLEQAGGFASVKRSVTPEAHFARRAASQDGYSFVRSDSRLGITSDKTPPDQLAAAIQRRYPQLHRRPELVLATACLEVLVLLAPLALALYALLMPNPALFVLAAAACGFHTYSFVRLQSAVFTHSGLQPWLSFFPAVALDIFLVHYSMYKYEFSAVYWRGRNICYPVMRRQPAGRGQLIAGSARKR